MAAIIAQLSLRNRAMKKRKREDKMYSTSKSLYLIRPYDATFQPNVHNKYMAARKKRKAEEIVAEIDKEWMELTKKPRKQIPSPEFSKSSASRQMQLLLELRKNSIWSSQT